MPDNILANLLAERDWLLADGATGTNYFSMGLQSGDAPELWNRVYPDRVAQLHREFVSAGADILLTNSFGGSAYRLKLHQAQDQVTELNAAAAQIAREVADAAGRPVLVAGSVGPTGEILQPVGALGAEDAQAAFAEQASALAQGGADMIWLETMSSKEELQAAGAGAAQCGLPVVATMTFDTNGSTMMGVPPAQLVDIYRETVPRLAAFGANCGVGAADLVGAVLAMRRRISDADVLVAKANCGIPQFVDGEIRYSGTPELMAEYARLALDTGARIIGGCCGTTPTHLAAMHQALVSHKARSIPELDAVVASLGPVAAGTAAACSDLHGDGGQTQRRTRGNRRRRASG
ncbi:MAG: methionine synthase I [Acidiferrobacteraceae bacterium]|nr:methionine synthase I [Acidiferrobacteraceae bacterium]HJP06102.1 betaine--homocysteine S-methyltransferase [Arenicellales bacterium]|tara:strand:+ start:1798 stop:2844 length:1047 start_codon:yes stop_codon:yes gene_type:complete